MYAYKLLGIGNQISFNLIPIRALSVKNLLIYAKKCIVPRGIQIFSEILLKPKYKKISKLSERSPLGLF